MGRRRTERHGKALVQLVKSLGISDRPISVAEIGVYRGQTSAILLADVPTLTLEMVDPWCTFAPDSNYAKSGDFMANQTQVVQEENLAEALRVTKFAETRRKILRAASQEAAVYFNDESFDLIFIDAEHTYEAVKQDIALWWPKVRPGGILSGHDYSLRWPRGVKQAVDEWASSNGKTMSFAEGHVWWTNK